MGKFQLSSATSYQLSLSWIPLYILNIERESFDLLLKNEWQWKSNFQNHLDF